MPFVLERYPEFDGVTVKGLLIDLRFRGVLIDAAADSIFGLGRDGQFLKLSDLGEAFVDFLNQSAPGSDW